MSKVLIITKGFGKEQTLVVKGFGEMGIIYARKAIHIFRKIIRKGIRHGN